MGTAAARAGTAYLAIRPDFTDVHRDIAAQLKGLEPDAFNAGRSIGDNLARGIKATFGDPLSGPMDESTRKSKGKAPSQGDQIAGAFAKGFQDRLRAAFASLPKAQITADSRDTDEKIQRIRAELEELSHKRIGIDLDAEFAKREIDELKAELLELSRSKDIAVRADTAAAAAKLGEIQAQVDKLDGKTAKVDVEASGGGLLALGWLSGGLAALPAAGALGAGIGALGGGLLSAGAGFGGLAAVAVPAISRVKAALDAQTQAQQNAGQTALQAQSNELALANAQQQLAAAIRNQAYAHQQALQAVGNAEQQFTQAQVSAGDAQRALSQARIDAQRHIEDLKNSLVDAGLAIEQDEINVQKAKLALDQLTASSTNAVALQQAQAQLAAAMQAQRAVDNDPYASQTAKDVAASQVQAAQAALQNAQTQKTATDLQRKEAELAYQEAIQHLKEEQLAQQRLAQDTQKATKAGVDGSEQVIQAREHLSQADAQVANAEQALASARANVARSDQQAADQVASARRAVTSATLQGEQANAKLNQSIAVLTPAEKVLMGQWKAFTATYKDWTKALEPDVLPVLSDGIGLVGSQLQRSEPLIRASSAAFRILVSDAKDALAGPFWSSFLADVSVEAPQAILGFGAIAGHTLEGLAGVFRAFLPYTQQLLGGVDSLTKRFDQWGQSLGSSSGFANFMSTMSHDGPLVVKDLSDIGSAFLSITRAVYPLGQLELQVIGPLAQTIGQLARDYPGLIQVGVALFALNKVIAASQVIPVAKGFLALGGAEGVAATGAAGLGVKLRTVGVALADVDAEAATTKDALLGLGKGGLVIGGITAAGFGISKLQDSLDGTTQDTSKLEQALVQLGQTGKFTGALVDEFQAHLVTGGGSLRSFREDAHALEDPSLLDYFNHGLSAAFANTIGYLGGVKSSVTEAHDKFKNLDDTLKTMATSGQQQQAAAAFQVLSDQLQTSGLDIDKINKLFPNYTTLVGAATTKNQLFTQAIQAQNTQMSQSAHAFQDEQGEIIAFQQGIATATGLLGTNGQAFFGNSAAALANRQEVIQLAGTIQTYADQLASNNQLTDANIAKLRGQKDQLEKVIEKFGVSHDAAEAYVNQLVKIPSKVDTKINVAAQGTMSIASSSGLNSLLQGLLGPGNKFGNTQQLVQGNAGGGFIMGGGGPRADNHIRRVSAGEFIVNAPATSKYLPLLAAINNEGNAGTPYEGHGYAGGGLIHPTRRGGIPIPGFAGGGLVTGDELKNTWNFSGSDGGVPGVFEASAARVGDAYSGMVAYAIGRTAAFVAGVIGAILAGGSGDGAKAVQFAEAQLGKPYVWGATGPDSFDCSGLTMRAWEAAGKEIGRTTYDQINAGTAGTRDQALPGDLHLPEKGHVMMFVRPRSGGAQEMIEAPHTGAFVQYAPFRGGGWVRLIATPGGAAGGGGSSQSASAAQAFAQAQLGQFGWGVDQMTPLIQLWNQESGWRWDATNPSSGAYGIPQSLPADKMASAGADWRTNAYTQIRWGLGYIHDRYGSPSGAEAHELAYNWYDQGGWLQPGLNLALNATGRPEPILTSQQWDSLLSGASGGGTSREYHAHFDGASSAALQSQVRTAFHVMDMEAAMHERVGRRR